MGGSVVRSGDATTSWTRGPREAEWEATVQHEETLTTSQGGQEQDATRGGGGGERKLTDVTQWCHKRQHGNQLGQTRGKLEAESLGQREAAAHKEATVLTRRREAEAVR
jgi:hypothetical protein